MGSVNWGALAKEAGDIQPVPVGKYLAIITKAELKVAASQNEYWQTVFRIQEGPQAGRLLYNNFVLVEGNPNALRAFFINMNNLGITQDQLVALGTDKNQLTPLLVGRQALLTVSHREYQGQMKDNVERVERHPAGPIGNLQASAAPGGAVPGAAPIPTAAPVPVAAAPIPVAAPAPAPAAPAPVPAAAPVAPVAPVAAPPAPAPVPAPAPAPAPVAAPAPAPAVAPPAPVAAAPVADVPAALDPSIGQAPAAPMAAPVPVAAPEVPVAPAPVAEVPAAPAAPPAPVEAAPAAPVAAPPAPPAAPF